MSYPTECPVCHSRNIKKKIKTRIDIGIGAPPISGIEIRGVHEDTLEYTAEILYYFCGDCGVVLSGDL